MRSLSAWSLATLGVVAGCAGSEPSASVPAGASATPAGPSKVAAPGVPYAAMTNEQKLNHMKMVIQPTMGKVFVAFDAARFADFGCKTCHGDKREDPHVALPKIAVSGDGMQKLTAKKPLMMRFMTEQVTPAMATAMGEPPFDPVTKKGFGCGGCHALE